MNKLLIIGCGHMGSALLEKWVRDKSYKITTIDPIKSKSINKKFKKYNVKSYNSIDKVTNIETFDIIVLAVKPQITNSLFKKYQSFNFKKNTLLISIVAGKKILYLKKLFPSINQVVRVMPNMPSLVGEGVSCLVSNQNVSKVNKNKVTILFSKVGIALWLKTEKDINIATAISGSGPGYIFYIIDALEKASNKLGLNDKINKKIVLQTFLGSIKLLQNSKYSASDLANTIAIKGGTTEAGIKTMKKNKIDKILSNTLLSAYKKASNLGKK